MLLVRVVSVKMCLPLTLGQPYHCQLLQLIWLVVVRPRVYVFAMLVLYTDDYQSVILMMLACLPTPLLVCYRRRCQCVHVLVVVG
jgi:hypothetical protein